MMPIVSDPLYYPKSVIMVYGRLAFVSILCGIKSANEGHSSLKSTMARTLSWCCRLELQRSCIAVLLTKTVDHIKQVGRQVVDHEFYNVLRDEIVVCCRDAAGNAG